MLLVSKEVFYVLSHVCQSLGQTQEAHKCLDRVDTYIEQQRINDDALYKKTLHNIEGNAPLGNKCFDARTLTTDLGLAGESFQ